jgi:uncharacterized membrane-anchored protein YhcB (DUF1043 family)
MLQCNNCTGWIHDQCTHLSKYELAKYIPYKSPKYACQECTLNDEKTISYVTNVLTKIDNTTQLSKVTEIIQNELSKFKSSIDIIETSVASVIENVTQNYNKLYDKQDLIQHELVSTKNSIESLKNNEAVSNAQIQEESDKIMENLLNLKKYDNQSATNFRIKTKIETLKMFNVIYKLVKLLA